jgi:hypothetical protein
VPATQAVLPKRLEAATALATHGRIHRGVGRGCGVGRGLGVTLGVAVAVGVELGVGVAVGVGEGAPALYNSGISLMVEKSRPPAASTIPSDSKTAVCRPRALLKLPVTVQVPTTVSHF